MDSPEKREGEEEPRDCAVGGGEATNCNKVKEVADHKIDIEHGVKVDRADKEKTPEVSQVCKSVRFSVTEAEVSVTEAEVSDSEDYDGEDSDLNTNPNNPRITISEPSSSPCEIDGGLHHDGPRGRCPIYYGVKSYIHDFYQPPDKELLKSGEYIQEDDFHFLVEPGKRRWKGCWFRTGLWLGVNLMLLGIIAMLVGHLTNPRQTIVDKQDNFTVLDRWAVTFNNRLVICQLAGLAGFTCGAVIVMLALLVSSYQKEQTRGYYVMAATVVPETFVGNPLAGPRLGWTGHRIPLSGSVRGVQPTFVRTH